MNTKDNPKSAAIGVYKEYLLIERKDIEALKETAINLLKDADTDTSKYHKGMAIIDTIHYLKERNIYNREFRYKQ